MTSMGAVGRFPRFSLVPQRVWKGKEEWSSTWCGHALIASPCDQNFLAVQEVIGDLGGTSAGVTMGDLLPGGPGLAGDLLVVSSLVYPDVDDLVDGLLALRATTPIPIILLAECSQDDFSSSRSPICDVTLRLPVGRNRVILALEYIFGPEWRR